MYMYSFVKNCMSAFVPYIHWHTLSKGESKVWVCLCPFPLFGIFSFKVKCTSSFSTSTKFFGKMPLVTWSSLQSHQPMIQLKALSNPNRFLHQLTSSHYFKLLKQRFQFSIINGSLWIDAYFFYSEGGVKYWIN